MKTYPFLKKRDYLLSIFQANQKKKSQLKKIMIPKELAQEILKRKQDHDGEECLFNIGANKKLEEYTQVCPSFELT